MTMVRQPRIQVAATLFFVLQAVAMPVAFAQMPVANGAVNSASFATPDQPHGKLARGGIFSLFGVSMSNATERAASFPLPTTLGGTEVEVTISGVTRKAILLFASLGQINAILPSDLPAGPGSLRVLANGQVSEPLAVEVVNHSFGIYSLRSSGNGPGVITDPLDPNPSTAPNTVLRSAHAGEPWDLWGTGLAALEASDAEAPQLADRTDVDAKVLVAGEEAQIVYRGRSPCCAGLDQIRFLVPAGIEGCCIPVQVVVEGVRSNVVTMSIANEGRVCSSDLIGGLTDMFQGDVIDGGGLAATRVVTFTKPTEGEIFELVTGWFVKYRVDGLILDPCFNGGTGEALPSGPCVVARSDGTVIAFDLEGNELGRVKRDGLATSAAARLNQTPAVSLDRLSNVALEQMQALESPHKDQVAVRPLDAGPAFTLEGPNGSWPVPFTASGNYSAVLSMGKFNGQPNGVFQDGQYRFLGQGGADVGAFSVDFPVHSLFKWTNKEQALPEILRHEPLRVEWSGGGSPFDRVAVDGTSISVSPSFVSSGFSCSLEYSSGAYTIPASVLRWMPSSSASGGVGSLTVSGTAAEFVSIPGLDSAGIAYQDGTSLFVPYGGEGEALPAQSAQK
jgi:uncharacterized protein (TIGR03437 family)